MSYKWDEALQNGEVKAGQHYYDGNWMPEKCEKTYFPLQTFSVKIFRAASKFGGGFKQGRCILRVRGNSDHPELVYQKASEICANCNSGIIWIGAKVKTVNAFPKKEKNNGY